MAQSISDDQILNAALNVIVQHGYAGATTRQISAAAGINEVTLFRRFGNKKKLLAAVVEQEADKFVAAGTEYTGDVEADLARVVHFYHDLVQSRGRVITMLLNELPRQPELLEIMQTPLAIIGKITTLIERYQQEGILVTEPPMHAFVALVGPLFMSGVFGFIQADLFEVSCDPTEMVQRYLHGHAQG